MSEGMLQPRMEPGEQVLTPNGLEGTIIWREIDRDGMYWYGVATRIIEFKETELEPQ